MGQHLSVINENLQHSFGEKILRQVQRDDIRQVRKHFCDAIVSQLVTNEFYRFDLGPWDEFAYLEDRLIAELGVCQVQNLRSITVKGV